MKLLVSVTLTILCGMSCAWAGSVSIGTAPKGDAKKIATKIIKYNFPSKCHLVTSAIRLGDGSIRATCDGTDYRVFTVYTASEGKMTEVALNCTAEKQLLNIDCYR